MAASQSRYQAVSPFGPERKRGAAADALSPPLIRKSELHRAGDEDLPRVAVEGGERAFGAERRCRCAGHGVEIDERISRRLIFLVGQILAENPEAPAIVGCGVDDARSEARRVGKECVSTCRSRWSKYN